MNGAPEMGHIRFWTQRAARSRAGFEAPSQRRDGGRRHTFTYFLTSPELLPE